MNHQSSISAKCIALIVFLAVSAPTATAFDLWSATILHDDPEEVRRTWLGAEIRSPGRLLGPDIATIFGPLRAAYVHERLEMLPNTLNLPVVVFLHGCTGISIAEHKFARIMDAAGIVTLQINSFARSERKRNCNYQSYTSGMFPPAYLYRRAEMIYAVSQVRKFSWVDSKRITLGGYSEGAVAVALWGNQVDVNGYIIAAWTCTAPREFAWLNGLRVPSDKPVFTVVSKRDRWFDWAGWRGDCATAATDRRNVEALVIDGGVHNVFAYPETEAALVAFMRVLHKR